MHFKGDTNELRSDGNASDSKNTKMNCFKTINTSTFLLLSLLLLFSIVVFFVLFCLLFYVFFTKSISNILVTGGVSPLFHCCQFGNSNFYIFTEIQPFLTLFSAKLKCTCLYTSLLSSVWHFSKVPNSLNFIFIMIENASYNSLPHISR